MGAGFVCRDRKERGGVKIRKGSRGETHERSLAFFLLQADPTPESKKALSEAIQVLKELKATKH